MISFRLLPLATILIFTGCSDICGNEVSQTVRSPSGKFAAVVFSRNCGATTGFNTQVAILPAGPKMANDAGNTFIANGTLPLTLRWQTGTALQISGVGTVSPLKKESQVSGVTVSYAL
jgi:hypothetical protein